MPNERRRTDEEKERRYFREMFRLLCKTWCRNQPEKSIKGTCNQLQPRRELKPFTELGQITNAVLALKDI